MDNDFFETLVSFLPEHWEGGLGLAIVVCAIITAIWPKPSENAHPFWQWLYKIINMFAINIGYAQNIPPDKKKSAKASIRGLAEKIGLRRRKVK